MTAPELKTKLFKTAADWEKWLAEHHDQPEGVWLQLAKKNKGVTTVTYLEAVEVALCYGWIDGQMKRLDDTYVLQKFTPRRAKSIWSKINVDRVAKLIETGRMQAPGLAAVEAAKADGRWERAYGSPTVMEIPPELAEAFKAHPDAKAFFDTLNKTNQYAIKFQITTAVRPETKKARAEKFIAMLQRGEKIY